MKTAIIIACVLLSGLFVIVWRKIYAVHEREKQWSNIVRRLDGRLEKYDRTRFNHLSQKRDKFGRFVKCVVAVIMFSLSAMGCSEDGICESNIKGEKWEGFYYDRTTVQIIFINDDECYLIHYGFLTMHGRQSSYKYMIDGNVIYFDATHPDFRSIGAVICGDEMYVYDTGMDYPYILRKI